MSIPILGTVKHPENDSVSYPTGGAVKLKTPNILTARIYRMKAVVRDQLTAKDLGPDIRNPKPGDWQRVIDRFRGLIDPALFQRELVWASVGHNERVDRGAAIQFQRLLGTTGTGGTAAGVFVNIALANASLVPAAAHLSLNSNSDGVTTNEFTTLGLSRAAGVAAGYSAPASLNATASGTVANTFAVTGTATVHGSGLFDHITPASGDLWVEANFTEGSASVVNTDSLVVTWTITM